MKFGVLHVSRNSTMVQGFLAAAVAVGALAVSAPASALILKSAAMDTSNTALISGPGYSTINAYIGPVTFTANSGGPNDPNFSLTAYCVDIYHDMFLGPLNGGNGYAYHNEALTTDSKTSTPSGQNGAPLSAFQLREIKWLLDYSDFLDDSIATDISHKQAGIQGAIWEVENLNITVNGSVVVNHFINKYKADAAAVATKAPNGSHAFGSIFADDYGHQAFAYGLGVPEPATWTMMILGFGGVGAVLRRRRQSAALA